MCMDNETGIRFIRKNAIKTTPGENLQVDKSNVYFAGKAIPIKTWRGGAFDIGLQADIYLDIAAIADNKPGSHQVTHDGRSFAVNVGDLVQSQFGPYSLVKSVKPYKS